MKHCNLPFTKCYPLFCTLSNFDTSGGESLHQFVQYSFLHISKHNLGSNLSKYYVTDIKDLSLSKYEMIMDRNFEHHNWEL